MSSQIAKLFIRGRIQNTCRNLSAEELSNVTKLMNIVYSSSDMKNTIHECSQALARTIGNEYKNLNAGLEEVWIAIWQAAVQALYHRHKKDVKNILNGTCTSCKHYEDTASKKCSVCGDSKFNIPDSFTEKTISEIDAEFEKLTGKPAPHNDMSIIDNKISRNKFFKTCIFNYLKQILRENRITTSKEYITIVNTADLICKKLLTSVLSEHKVEFTIDGDNIITDLNMLPNDAMISIAMLANQMSTNNIDMELSDNVIKIIRTSKSVPVISASVLEKTRTQDAGFQVENTDGDQDTVESHIADQQEPEQSISDMSDTLLTIRNRLTSDAQKVFDIIVRTPDEYSAKYSGIKKSNIAEYLNMSIDEVNGYYDIIKLQMQAVSLV